VRLFVGVWPPPEVVAALEAIPRPQHPSVRWLGPEQWHVTLRFLGEVPDAEVPDLEVRLATVARLHHPQVATLGPETRLLGRGMLVAPVSGLDDLARAVTDATRDVGRPPERRAFTGHITLARGRGRSPIPASLAGQPVTAQWTVEDVTLVRSHLSAAGARYEVLAVAPLTA
jgi:2'-5' RNA ligase